MAAQTDTYSCGREQVLELFALSPLELPREIHEHCHHDGGYFTHAHEGGQAPHSHTRRCKHPGCRHNYEREGQ
jgi:hypothetical protein